MEKEFNKIQIAFFETYKKIESEKLILKALNGSESKWSSSAMFNLTPLYIERSRGNVFYDIIHDSKPNESRITEAVLNNNKIITLKNWRNNELIGLSVFSYKNENEINQISVSIDDDEQKLRSIIVYYLDNNKIVKKNEATVYGALIEKYIYENDRLNKI